ncbi:MAG: hypothetical protein M1133_06900 [Armatimonadetes bacterium]|nr:hypothetical protein [Armatimonadota bacterium]
MIVNDPNLFLWVKQCNTQANRVNGALGPSKINRDGKPGGGYKRGGSQEPKRDREEVGRNLDVSA